MSIAPPRPDCVRPTRRPLAVAVQGKGLGQTLGRAVTVGGRYGVSPARMLRRLDHLVSVLDRYDAPATLPITAAAVARHPRALDRYVARGIEFAVHGLHHVDHLGVGAADQRAQVQRACDILADSGVAVTGFRAPYLRCDDATLAAVRAAGLIYDASPAVHWSVPPADLATDTYQRGLAFYGATGAHDRSVVPWVEDGLVRIPYSLPDDESLVERLHLGPARIAQVWLAMFEQAHAAGDLLTVSLHPERIVPCADGIAAVLAAARRQGSAVWVTSLGEVARWWSARTRARVAVQDLGPDRVALRLQGPADLALVGRGLALPGGRTRPDGTATTTAREMVLPLDGRRPFVGLHPGCPTAVRTRLQAAGYVVETTDRPTTHARYVEGDQARDHRRLLAILDGDGPPLVRLARWPGGARSAVVVTGDVDALTVGDFAWRLAGR